MRTVSLATLILTLILTGGMPVLRSQQTDEITEVSFERKGCRGWCPVDFVVFRRDGSRSYTGVRYVDRIGSFQAEQSEYKFDVLVRVLERVSYAQLKDEYGGRTSDASTITLRVTRGGKLKTVTSYNPESTPIELVIISSFIENVVGKIRWKKVE